MEGRSEIKTTLGKEKAKEGGVMIGEGLRFTLIDNDCVNKEVVYENSSEEKITSR